MNKKIIFSLFTLILLIGLIGFAFSDGETTTKTIDVGVMKEIFANIFGNGVNVISGENGNTLTFLDRGSVNISGDLFENVEKDSSIVLDSSGNIKSADLTASGDTSFNFKGDGTYKILKGERIKYENGKAIISGKAGDSIGFKPELLDESGNNIGKFSNIKLNGDSIDIEKAGESTTIKGNFDMGDNSIKGIGNNAGEITVSKDGRISEIWTGTDATMKGVNFKVSGKTLNIYYDENFDVSSHVNENYFNYGINKISAGGTGFSSDLGKTNNIFGDMKTTKYVDTVIGTKTRDLGFTLDGNGGNLEISRDTTNSDLGFNIKGDGDYIINNGRAIIESQEISKIVNGKLTPTGESSLFVKANEDKEGLLYSYNLNFNNGEYKLENNLFENKAGNVLVNLNNEWEDYIKKINGRDANEIIKLKEEIDGEKGVNARDYAYLLKDREGLVKMFCEARDSANENKDGVKISLEELIARYMLEGGAEYESGYPIYDYDHIGSNAPVWGSTIGLDNIGDPTLLKKLKDFGFIPEDFQISRSETMTNELYQNTLSAHFSNIQDSLTAFAGELARRKDVFEADFKQAYGEDEFKKMTDDEKYFWLTYYFNSGEGAGKGQLTGTKYYTYNANGEPIVVQGKGRENVYKSWTGPEPGQWGSSGGEGTSSLFNAVLSEATYKLFKLSKIFSYV